MEFIYRFPRERLYERIFNNNSAMVIPSKRHRSRDATKGHLYENVSTKASFLVVSWGVDIQLGSAVVTKDHCVLSERKTNKRFVPNTHKKMSQFSLI